MGDCPACGEFIDYCQGHGEIGDPDGAQILQQHDDGNHIDCHPAGCDEFETPARRPMLPEYDRLMRSVFG